MTRAEYDLPPHFLAHQRKAIDTWLEHSKPGDTLCIPAVPTGAPPALYSSFVSSSAIERNTIELRASEIIPPLGRGDSFILVGPADARSRRLVDREEERLKPARPTVAANENAPQLVTLWPYGPLAKAAA